ncbi:uncharacterized protein E0L32_007061 [Thyridium curvatum]|uniref:Thioredoxin domain-containing protein n=1 Tax=Thyridium curvatum TaxID=1093900 RepID=A0A507AN44_9PEZI|nr:uncharacterized protein E0L32_007061 [Thyridium curvatum]TPX12175.1 hypothetical protein E0L32_007061 [Thyridium curvatum]
MTVNIGSAGEWSRIIKSSTVVVADFYADWCGPCKQIAPAFESLSTKFSKPGKITFVKVNTDNQQDITKQYRVSAMPTFLILHNGAVIETVQGANPMALNNAVEKAVKLAGTSVPGAGFATPGRTLGGAPRGSRQSLGRPVAWDLNNLINTIVTFFGLYVTSLISLDPYQSAQNSRYNIKNPPPSAAPGGRAGSSFGSGGQRVGGPAAPRSSFRTLADLGSE